MRYFKNTKMKWVCFSKLENRATDDAFIRMPADGEDIMNTKDIKERVEVYVIWRSYVGDVLMIQWKYVN